MSAHAVFLEGIRDIERIVRMHGLKRFMENAGVVFLCLHTVSSGMQWFGQALLTGGAFFYPAAGLSLIAAAVLKWYGKKSLYDRLIEIDAAFHLQDRLSTAYECLQQNRQTVFLDLLIEDAGHKISHIDKKKIFPKKISWIHLLLGFLILINVLMAAVKNPLVVQAPDAVDPDMTDRIQRVITQFSIGSPEKEPSPNKIVTDRIENRMAGLSDMLHKPPVHRRPLSTMVHNTLKEIQGDKIARARDLVEELGLDTADEITVQQIRQAGTLTHFQLRKLNELVKKMFDDQIPEGLAQDLAVLDDRHRLEAYLEQILEDLEKGQVQKPAPQDNSSGDSERPVSGQKTGSQHGSNTQEEATSTQHSDSDRHPSSIGADPRWSGKDGSPEEASEGELGEGPSSPGRGKSESSSGLPDEPDRLKGSAVQDKTASSTGSEISVLIRSLTATGKAKMKKAPIVRDYQQAVEGVLEKEDIPLKQRTFIRNYFLSIGLRKDPPGSGKIQ